MDVPKLNNSYTLISIQPLMKSQNTIEQWNYYENILISYLKKNKISENQKMPLIVALPEYALGNSRKNRTEPPMDELKELISNFASTNNLILIGGSFAIKDENSYKNRLLIWDNNGKIVTEYDKKFLFNFEKRQDFTPGITSGLVSIFNNFKIKVMICSDLWYPEEIRSELHENINLLIVPAMSVVPEENKIAYGRWLWHSLAITRARENVIPVVVSDWAMQSLGESSAWTCGASSIIDPSIRWTNDEEYRQAFNHFKKGETGIISSTIHLDDVNEYKKYRQEVGLLPPD